VNIIFVHSSIREFIGFVNVPQHAGGAKGSQTPIVGDAMALAVGRLVKRLLETMSRAVPSQVRERESDSDVFDCGICFDRK
jgi:hypothetical protein